MSSWFAALFYLPRIFVNLAQVAPESRAERDRLLGMARRLHRFGMVLMTVALVLGLWLWLGYGIGRGQGWMHAKLALVLGVFVYQHVCLVILRRFERQQPTLTLHGLVSDLLREGFLKTDSPYGAVRFAIPNRALRFYFPSLWPEAEEDEALAARGS